MAKNFIRKENITKNTIITLGKIGIITLASLTSPYFLHSIAKIYFKDKINEMIRKRARKLRELQKRKLIDFKELPNGTTHITLSYKGKNLIRQYHLDSLTLKKPSIWDKKWHFVIYDIPVTHPLYRNASRSLSRKLKEMGLYQLQKSIWLSPYDFLPELEFISTVFNIKMDKHIYYFTSQSIPKEKEIRKFFNI